MESGREERPFREVFRRQNLKYLVVDETKGSREREREQILDDMQDLEE